MAVESINSSYTPPPIPEQSAPVTYVEETPAPTQAPVEAPNTSINVDIIA